MGMLGGPEGMLVTAATRRQRKDHGSTGARPADQTTLGSNKRTCLVNKAKSNQRILIAALFSTQARQHVPTHPHARVHTHHTHHMHFTHEKEEKESRLVSSLECTNKMNYHSSYALSSQIFTVLSNI